MKPTDAPLPATPHFARAGDFPPLQEVRIVALYDADYGQVVSRHVVARFEGADDVSDDAIVSEAFERVKAFYDGLERDPERKKRLLRHGQELCPIDKLKAAVTRDIRYFDEDFVVDPKTGEIKGSPSGREG